MGAVATTLVLYDPRMSRRNRVHPVHYRVVTFHLQGRPESIEIAALQPGDDPQAADVLTVDYDDVSCWVTIEVPVSTSPADATIQAKACIDKMLPSVNQLSFAEEGITVFIKD